MQENYQDLEKLRKELRMTRIFSGITSLLLICVLVGGCIVFLKVQGYMEDSMPLVEALENFNDAVEALKSFTGSVKEFFSKFGGGINFGNF